ncbi:MAG TPA: thiamine phosphate synthase [candidate division Zixibacteria bacterium]|nr:thiamine phosphate synthase [candidate division Zixibacteria bacterium]
MSRPPLRLEPLYAILDPDQTAGRGPEAVLAALLAGGVRLLQLRVKSGGARAFLALAERARQATRAAGCRLIVNDRADIALASDADGVHLGQEDLPLSRARALMGSKIVGISTHTVEQALEAERGGADYIGFGPVFGTTTKETGYEPRGTEMLRRVRRAVTIPVVAIGGIDEANVAAVWRAGADSAAMIGALVRGDAAAAARRILAAHRALASGARQEGS